MKSNFSWRLGLSAVVVSGLLLALPVGLSARPTLGRAVSDPASRLTVYVTSPITGTVTPIDLATNTPGTPITSGAVPWDIAIMPDGSTAYVTNLFGGTVTPIDLATNTAGTPIHVGDEPNGIAITPDGTTAYVANGRSNTVTPIETATNTPGTPIPVSGYPYEIAITPDGTTAYVTSLNGNTVTPIDVATNAPGTPIPVGYQPRGIAITPDGTTAYVAISGISNATPIDLATNTPGTPIRPGPGPLFCQPFWIAITPDGKTAYVSCTTGNTVTPIDLATNKFGVPIPIGDWPNQMAITPDSTTGYVVTGYPSGPGAVRLLDLKTNTSGTSIPVANGPNGIAIRFTALDTTPPVIDVPADVVVDATGPAGAIVAFKVTATDENPAQPDVTCLPASGSLFTIGDTTVSCTAADAAGNIATASFVVHVRGAAEQLASLAATVKDVGAGTSLADKIAQVQAALNAGDSATASSILDAFTHEVSAQAGKKIAPNTAAALIEAATQLEAVLALEPHL